MVSEADKRQILDQAGQDGASAAEIARRYDSGRLPDSDEESRVIVQYLPASGATSKVGDTNPSLALPATLRDGMQTFTLGNEEYRILVKTLASGERIAVAQETGLRNEIARDSALRTVMPFLILVPILFLVVADLIRKMFRPITTLSAEIDQRSEQELHPFTPERLPVEVRPFVIAINRLLGRVSRSMDIQRRFVADAAHELRSPLTALSLQAERLADAEMSEAARERLATLRRGIERGRALMDQLLTLARAQSTVATLSNEVSVQQGHRIGGLRIRDGLHVGHQSRTKKIIESHVERILRTLG